MRTPLLLAGLALAALLPSKDVLAPLAAPPVAVSGAEAEAALRSGQARLAAGDAAGAERVLREGLRRTGDRGLLYVLGAQLFGRGRLAEAEGLFEDLARRSPDLADAWYQLGLVRAARGRYRDAADAQRLAVAHSPAFGQAYCALALDLRESGQTKEGLSAAREALRLLPGYAGGWNLLGNLQLDQGRMSDAMQSYRRALELEPRYPGAWFNLAVLLEKAGRGAEANDAYSRALRVKPDFGEALLARAELELSAGDLARARADFAQAAGLKDWRPEGHWGLQRVAAARGRKAEAAEQLEAYRRAVRARDRALAREAGAGLERPSPYEPGLPLAGSGAPVDGGGR